MVPNYYMKLDKIPTNANGKADRKVLPIPYVSKKEKEYVSPKNEVEEIVQKCVQETLKIEQVSVETDLFDIGLTSLGVISIITKLSMYDYELKVKDFYECHTISEIAELLQRKNVTLEDYEEDKKYYQDVSDIQNHLLPMKEANSILLTGATSFLGIHLIREIIKNTTKNIYCVVRSREKFERFIDNFTDLSIDNPRIIIVEGDITKENLGFENNLANEIKINCSDVIHSAANVSFFCPWDISKSVNYDGTCHVIRFT